MFLESLLKLRALITALPKWRSQLQTPNLYLQVLRNARSDAANWALVLRTALDPAIAAFEHDAWVGGEAGTAYYTMNVLRSSAQGAADLALDELDYAIKKEPELVYLDDWRATCYFI
jgi:hypothetical protein